jgi:nucleotide-binding universal stress UspA family protein
VLLDESEDCDLLVGGSRGQRRDRRHSLGSVALHLLYQTGCPITVVR